LYLIGTRPVVACGVWRNSFSLPLRLSRLVVAVSVSRQRFRVRFPALPYFLSSCGSETGSTQTREDNWGATWKKSSGSGLENWDYRPWVIRHADHATPFYPQKLALKFADQWQSFSRYSSFTDKMPRSFAFTTSTLQIQ
jgi:hypothetical protein